MLALRTLVLLNLVLMAVAIVPARAEVKGPYLGGPQPDPPGLKTAPGPYMKAAPGPYMGGPQPDPPGLQSTKKKGPIESRGINPQ